MTPTSCSVKFISENAVSIKADATFSTTSLNTVGNLDDLKNDSAEIEPYATYEPDFWLLDGNYKFIPDTNIHGGYVSAIMSPSNPASDFASAPKIEILFSELQSIEEITLRFSENTGDWSDRISIGFFNGGSTISAAFYTPTSAEFTLTLTVANFNKIEIYFYSQNKAYRYARLNSIDIGEIKTFSGNSILSAKVVEEVSQLSTELPINTLDLKLFSPDSGFSIVDPSNFFSELQYKTPMDVYGYINTYKIYIGRFYLDTWNSVTEKQAVFTATNVIGLLDKITYYGIADSPFARYVITNWIEDIFNTAGMDYEIDPELGDLSLSLIWGWLPICSCREALQKICFAIGAYVNINRNKVIQIKKMHLVSEITDFKNSLTSAEKGISQSLTLKQLVTGVETVNHDYRWDTVDPSKVQIEGFFNVGEHFIIFDNPRYSGAWSGSPGDVTILSQGHHWMLIDVAVEGEYNYAGNGFYITKSVFGVYNTSLPANTVENIISINDATTVAREGTEYVTAGTEATQRVYDYYQQRYFQKVKLFASRVVVGDSVLVDVQNSRQLGGVIERMETDLSGGFISNVSITGIILP